MPDRALDVAERFPSITVHGTDLYPPPTDWIAPNCILEADDITKTWMWPYKLDLVHILLFSAHSLATTGKKSIVAHTSWLSLLHGLLI